MTYQTTLRDALAFEGIGLHTGARCRVQLLPAPPGSGLRFRVDDAVEFPARADHVVETERCTVVAAGEHRVSTVEHVLSALLGCGVDNAVIAVDGPEIPITDGSAKVFADAIEAVGVATVPRARLRWTPLTPRLFRAGDRMLLVAPAPAFRVRAIVDYPAPVGTQYVDATIDAQTYRAQIAPARTWGYRHEVEGLLARGLARGGTLENALVFDDRGPMTPLRLPDEPARHKVLDIIGDFALLGAYPQCEVIAVKSGHALHCAAVREMLPAAHDDATVALVREQ